MIKNKNMKNNMKKKNNRARKEWETQGVVRKTHVA